MSGSTPPTSPRSADGGLRCVVHPGNILFFAQIICIIVVVCVACANLTTETGNQQLWSLILTSCLGFIMPNPKLKVNIPVDQSVKGDSDRDA